MSVRVAVAGCGHWGQNFVRILDQTDEVDLVAVSDSDPRQMERVTRGKGDIRRLTPEELFSSGDLLDAIVISTPADTHYDMVGSALECGWHVLAEKPFTRTVGEAIELCNRAAAKGLILMLGHTFLYNDAVRKMKELLDDGAIGTPYYVHARRTHLGLIREDVNAVWDLAPHDISIVNYLLDATPDSVSARGRSFLRPDREDVAFINLDYGARGVLVNLFVSWADSHKVREVQVVGSRGRIVFNDLEPLERVKVFEKGVSTNIDAEGFGEYQLSLRDGSIYSPSVPASEPLREEVRHFLECVLEGTEPASDGWSGASVVSTLEAIDESMRGDGVPVAVQRTTVDDPVAT